MALQLLAAALVLGVEVACLHQRGGHLRAAGHGVAALAAGHAEVGVLQRSDAAQADAGGGHHLARRVAQLAMHHHRVAGHGLVRRGGAGHQAVQLAQVEARRLKATDGGGADLSVVHRRLAAERIDHVVAALDAVALEHQAPRPRRLAADQAEALLHLFVVDRVERQVGADAIDEDRVGHVESSGHFTRRTGRRSRPFHAESDPWTAEPAVS